MNITLGLRRGYSFQNQVRRQFTFAKGTFLTGELRIFASTWPFGIFHHESASGLGVEFAFPFEEKRWLYRGHVDCRRLWPAGGDQVKRAREPDHFDVGPLVGMRDDREEFHYILPDGEVCRFQLKYIGFECWVSLSEKGLDLTLRHFMPGDDLAVVSYSIPVEEVLFQQELKLSYDAEGYLEDAPGSRPFVRVEECPPTGFRGTVSPGCVILS